tara:strand:- start:4995 stop:5276 length:282 start_codon:yes stop_codon:yes gene_type:complete
MELEIIFKALISLGAVFLTMYIVLKILQKYSNIGSHSKLSAKGSGLKIENIVYIDESTKVVNISNKLGSHYILAVGKNNSFLIDKYEALTEKE